MRRGFTMVELAVVVSLLTLLVPLGLIAHRAAERQYLIANAKVDAASAARLVSEALRLDGWTAPSGGAPFTFETPCGEVRYVVEDEVLHRRAPAGCGGDRALARHVRALRSDGPTVTIDFSWRVRGSGRFELPVRLGSSGGAR